jgi:hypothetical protein
MEVPQQGVCTSHLHVQKEKAMRYPYVLDAEGYSLREVNSRVGVYLSPLLRHA